MNIVNRRHLLGYGATTLTGLASTGLTGLTSPLLPVQQVVTAPPFGRLSEVLDPERINSLRLHGGKLRRSGKVGREPANARSSGYQDQFFPFQLKVVDGSPRLVDPFQQIPNLETTQDKPDVAIRVGLDAFHLGEREDVRDNTRATLRLTIGEHGDNLPELLNWVIAAGMNLYSQGRNKPAVATELKGYIGAAFDKTPIKIPGGIGSIKFEVVKHKNPSWWKKIFGALTGIKGQALLQAFGLPAVTSSIIGLVDQAFDRFSGGYQTLFASSPSPAHFQSKLTRNTQKAVFEKLDR